MTTEQTTYNALGIMTGTSCDGIDLALIETDGHTHIQHIASMTHHFPASLREQLMQLTQDVYHHGEDILKERSALIKEYTICVTEALKQFDGTQKADIIGFSGQTVLHQPDKGKTIQIGLPQFIAEQTGIKTIFNFRQADMNVGGQGAPLAPLYHKALCDQYFPDKIVGFINIGGVANITYYNPHSDILSGWDTGPGNAIIDALSMHYFQSPYDHNGAIAGTGNIHQSTIDRILQKAFFSKKPPKSLDKHDFTPDLFSHLSDKDAIATATALTAQSIASAQNFFPQPCDFYLISGGGAHNPTLINHFKNHTSCPVYLAHEKNIHTDSLEAELFAWLAVRSLKQLPLSAPSVTGAHKEVSGGEIYY